MSDLTAGNENALRKAITESFSAFVQKNSVEARDGLIADQTITKTQRASKGLQRGWWLLRVAKDFPAEFPELATGDIDQAEAFFKSGHESRKPREQLLTILYWLLVSDKAEEDAASVEMKVFSGRRFADVVGQEIPKTNEDAKRFENQATNPDVDWNTDGNRLETAGLLKRHRKRLVGASLLPVFALLLTVTAVITGVPKEQTNSLINNIAYQLMYGKDQTTDMFTVWPTEPPNLISQVSNNLAMALFEIAGSRGSGYALTILADRQQHGYFMPPNLDAALANLETAANELEYVGAMESLAYAYRNGLGVPYDPEIAAGYLEEIIRSDSEDDDRAKASAHQLLGWDFLNGENGKPVNYDAALSHFRTANEIAPNRGSVGLAYMYWEGLGVGTDRDFAVELAHSAHLAGFLNGTRRLARFYASGHVPDHDTDDAFHDIDDALDLIRSTDYRRHALLLNTLVHLEEQKVLSGRDNSDDNPILEREAYESFFDDGSTFAAGRLAQMHLEEGALEQAWPYIAFMMSSESANHVNMAGNLFRGAEISGRYARALPIYERAACMGSRHAFFNLAELYEQGRFGENLIYRAFSLYQAAAERGSEGAKVEIARHYLDEDSVPYDPALGLFWLREAALTGEPWMKREYALEWIHRLDHEDQYDEAWNLLTEAAGEGDAAAAEYLVERLIWKANGLNSELRVWSEDITDAETAWTHELLELIADQGEGNGLIASVFGHFSELQFSDWIFSLENLNEQIDLDSIRLRDLLERAAQAGNSHALLILLDWTLVFPEETYDLSDELIARYGQTSSFWQIARLVEYYDDARADTVIELLLSAEDFDFIERLYSQASNGSRDAISLLRRVALLQDADDSTISYRSWFPALVNTTEQFSRETYDFVTIARVYRNGFGELQPDYQQAADYFRLAVQGGDGSSRAALLTMMADGAIPLNLDEAVQLLDTDLRSGTAQSAAAAILAVADPSEDTSRLETISRYADGDQLPREQRIINAGQPYELDCAEILQREQVSLFFPESAISAPGLL